MDAAPHGHGSHGSHAAAEELLPRSDPTTLPRDPTTLAGEHPPPGSRSERYELEDLFQGEAPENLHAIKVMGLVILSVLLLLALAYPVFIVLNSH